MSKISKLNIDEKLPIIKNLIEDKDPETKPNIITIYTISKCFNVSILEAIILLNQYVLKESDLSNYAIFFLCDTVDDSGTCFSKKIISSCEPKVNEILEDKKHTLSYGVFGICNIKEYYLMEDYRPFIGENMLITRFDFSGVPQNNFISLNEPIDDRHKEEKKESKAKGNKSAAKKDNKAKSKIDNKIVEKGEENYFGNFKPGNKAKTDKEKITLDVSQNLKRKKKGLEEDEIKEEHHKRNKKEFKEDEHEVKNENQSEIHLKEVKGESKDEDIQMKDITEGSENAPKRVKKVRRVKKTKRFMNEEGYMVTKDVDTEEEYSSDEKPEKKVAKNNFISQESKPNKNKKKVNKGQTTISSFFKK